MDALNQSDTGRSIPRKSRSNSCRISDSRGVPSAREARRSLKLSIFSTMFRDGPAGVGLIEVFSLGNPLVVGPSTLVHQLCLRSLGLVQVLASLELSLL